MDHSLAPLDATRHYHRPGGLAPWQIRRVLRHIADNLGTPTRVADLAGITRLSVSRFAHAFRTTFDASPAALIRRQRVQRASDMVLANQLPLAEIAVACGFSDQAHMCRLFRRQLDLPPGRWRVNKQGERVSASVSVAHRTTVAHRPLASSYDRRIVAEQA